MIKFLLTILLSLHMGNALSENDSGAIGRATENGLPVIYSFSTEIPSDEILNKNSWLTVISWKYEGSSNNGMPEQSTNEQMLVLEDALLDEFDNGPGSVWAYNRTGNGLKEFVYYIEERNQFIQRLNSSLENHPQYPIEINFYEDADWSDLKKLLSDFAGGD